VAFAALPAFPQAKPRVAVMNFDYATVSGSVAQIFGSSNTDVGRGIADLLVEKLVNDGKFQVIERKQIDKILAEQNFSNSDRVDANSAAKIGRILGVDAIIMGSITQFGRDDKQRNVGGFGRHLDKVGLGNVGVKSSKAVVALTARMVSADTAEILAVARGTGESSRSGTSLVGEGGGWRNAAGGVIDMRASNFAATILGEATTKASNDLASQLQSNATKIPAKVVTVDGLIADVSGNTLIINVGTRGGVKVGDRLEVKRVRFATLQRARCSGESKRTSVRSPLRRRTKLQPPARSAARESPR
jgi:curli biogenesis system outer membrane secretion channel CsgG